MEKIRMKHKHYTNEEIIEISKLLKKGKTYREIAIILDRDYTRLTKKINSLGLNKYKMVKSLNKKTLTEKLKYHNNKLKLCFEGKVEE